MSAPEARVVLGRGHVKPVWAGHPWVYAQAVAKLEGAPRAGDAVAVIDAEGRFLGRGFWSPGSALPVRLVTRDPAEPLDGAALARRIAAAAERRERLLGLPSETTDGFRLVHAEGDDLPGVVADRYGDTVVAEILTIGAWRHREAIFDALAALPGVTTVIAGEGREAGREGFSLPAGTVRGAAVETLRFRERELAWEVPLAVAQKTGFYFDQRDNRARFEALAADRRVLDACCYLGPFALAAARGGAREVLAMDRSEGALVTATAHAERGGWHDRVRFVRGDVRRDLGALADTGERFDLVVLDPPKLAPTARHLDRARKGYEGMNAAALRLVAPGGVLATCSCSAAMGPTELLRTVAAAARRAGRSVSLLELSGQAPDHPTPPAFEEGRYLACAWIEVRD